MGVFVFLFVCTKTYVFYCICHNTCFCGVGAPGAMRGPHDGYRMELHILLKHFEHEQIHTFMLYEFQRVCTKQFRMCLYLCKLKGVGVIMNMVGCTLEYRYRCMAITMGMA
jgi:hypothetical protein